MGLGRIRPQFDRAAQFDLRVTPVPTSVAIQPTADEVRFEQIMIDRKRFLDRDLGFLEIVERLFVRY